MKKELVLLVVLGLVAPAMAVTLTGAQVGTTNVGAIGYSGNGQAAKPDPTRVSGFALKITVDNGAVITACTRAAENANGANYGIFPGNINLANPASPVYNDAVEPDNLHGVGGASAIGTGQVIIAMGALHTSAPLPPASGQLVNITVSKSCTVTVQSDSARGGVVGEDAQTMTVSTLTFPMVLESAPLAPTISATQGTLSDRVRLTLASAGATSYSVYRNISNSTTGAVLLSSSAGASYDDITPHGETIWYFAKATNSAGTSGFSTGASGYITECFPAGTQKADWVTLGRPDCWCYSRQCKGDATGSSEGKSNYWVSTGDLNILKSAWNKTAAQVIGTNLACGDFSHTSEGKSFYRVSTGDLNILKSNWNQANGPAAGCNAAKALTPATAPIP